MADVVIGRDTEQFSISPSVQYSRVTIEVGHDSDGALKVYTAGDDTKHELYIKCPWGTQAMANNLLATLSSVMYQPYQADSSYVHPASEIGDSVEVGGYTSRIYARQIEFGMEPTTRVSAPAEDETEEDYSFEDQVKREVVREIITGDNDVKATLTVAIDEISLEVAGKIDGEEAQTLIDQTIGAITLSVSAGTQSNTTKITLTAGTISAESDNININANSINLSNANVLGYLNVAQNIQAGAITSEKLSTNAIQSRNYSGVWTIVYDGSDELDHDAEDYAVKINGTWYKFEAGVPLGGAEGSYDLGIVADMARMKYKLYTISTKTLQNVEYSFSTISSVTDEEELPLSASFGFIISGAFLDLANGDFHTASMDITSAGARFKGNLDSCKLRDCTGYVEHYSATYTGSGNMDFDESIYRESDYAGADHYFTFHEDDVEDVGWYDDNYVYIGSLSSLGIDIYDSESEGDIVAVTYVSVYSKVITLQDLKDLGLIP